MKLYFFGKMSTWWTPDLEVCHKASIAWLDLRSESRILIELAKEELQENINDTLFSKQETSQMYSVFVIEPIVCIREDSDNPNCIASTHYHYGPISKIMPYRTQYDRYLRSDDTDSWKSANFFTTDRQLTRQ